MTTRTIITKAVAIALLSLFASCAPTSKTDATQTFSAEAQSQASIIGGSDSTSDYQKANGIVGILFVSEDQLGRQMSGVCSGSLIAPKVVLTAAHCMVLSKGSKLVAFLILLDKNIDTIMTQISKDDLSNVRVVNKVVRHEAYLSGSGSNNDIGLLGFEGDLPADFKLAQRAPAQAASQLGEGTSLTLAGYGVSKYDKNEIQITSLKNDIQSVIHYPIPPHKQAAYRELNECSYPISELIHQEIISLPLSPVMLQSEIEHVVNVVNDYQF